MGQYYKSMFRSHSMGRRDGDTRRSRQVTRKRRFEASVIGWDRGFGWVGCEYSRVLNERAACAGVGCYDTCRAEPARSAGGGISQKFQFRHGTWGHGGVGGAFGIGGRWGDYEREQAEHILYQGVVVTIFRDVSKQRKNHYFLHITEKSRAKSRIFV